MKLAIVFEIPDGQADTYADVAATLIQHHAFAQQEAIKHWSFDQEMRPVAAAFGESTADLVDKLRSIGVKEREAARREAFEH